MHRAPRRWVPWALMGSSQQNPSCGHGAAQMKAHHRSFPHSINRQMPCVWIKMRGRQVLGAGVSRSPAPRAPSNDSTDQIQAHQPPHNMYSPKQQRNWGKWHAHSHRTRRELNSGQSNTHKLAKVWSACGWALETINPQPGPRRLRYYPFLNRDTTSNRYVQNLKAMMFFNWSAAASRAFLL